MTILRKASVGLVFAGMLGLASAASAAPVANGGLLQDLGSAAAGSGLVTKVHGCHGWGDYGWVARWGYSAYHYHSGRRCWPHSGSRGGDYFGGHGYRHHGRPRGKNHGCIQVGPAWICS